MKVLSLFDGISCGMVALERAGVTVDRYVAYEIDENAINVSKSNYPQIEHCGDVTTADFTQYKGFDLLIGGSPCQDFSTLGKREGLKGEKSILVNEYIRAFNEMKPKYFLLENNANMPKEAKEYISACLGVEPIRINSKQFTLQNRDRFYWTNIDIGEINIKPSIVFEQILDYKEKVILSPYVKRKIEEIKEKYGKIPHVFNAYNKAEIKGIFPCLTTNSGTGCSSSILIYENEEYYLVNSNGWELLQGLPLDYTKGISERKRKFGIGNGWTVDVISHILKGVI